MEDDDLVAPLVRELRERDHLLERAREMIELLQEELLNSQRLIQEREEQLSEKDKVHSETAREKLDLNQRLETSLQA